MKDKVELFLEAGAKEVWLITEDGHATYYNYQGQQVKSIYQIDLKGFIKKTLPIPSFPNKG